MAHSVRLVFSTDHSRKKTHTLDLPFGLYVDFVTSSQFESILPKALHPSYKKARLQFEKAHPFLNWSDASLYAESAFVRMITSEAVQKFFSKVLSLEYQSQKALLFQKAGSLGEFLGESPVFWNEGELKKCRIDDLKTLRAGIFCWSCLCAHYERLRERTVLNENLPVFAKQEIAARTRKIERLELRVSELEKQTLDQNEQIEALKQSLTTAQKKSLVVVPGDPYHMLGLPEGDAASVSVRSKHLLKVLHPDRSGTNDTAYLFDMVKKARDMILKSN